MLATMPKARSAALKVLQLDEGLAEAHASLALVTELNDWDCKAAEREFRQGTRLDPLSLIFGVDREVTLYYARQYGRSIAQFRSVITLDPVVGRLHQNCAMT